MSPDSISVVTSCTPSHFPGLMLLSESLRPFGFNLYCADLGLFEGQRAEARADGIELMTGPVMPNRESALWFKPECVAAFDGLRFRRGMSARMLWLDADAVMLDRPSKIFEALNDGPVFTYDFPSGMKSANKLTLLEFMPVIDRDVALNSGVFALDLARDRRVLKLWRFCAKLRFSLSEAAVGIRLHDQGSLAWAVAKLGMKNRILMDESLNQIANYSSTERKKYAREGMIDAVRADHPGAAIVHWMEKKWWELE